MAPVFGRLAKVYKRRMAFVAVNVYDRPDIAKRFGVRATPTFILIRKGKALRHFYGNIPEPLLKRHLAPYIPPPVDDTDQKDSEGGLGRVLRWFRGN